MFAVQTAFLGFLALCPLAGESQGMDPFEGAIYRTRNVRTGRISSWDHTGGNRDFLSIQPGETKELFRMDGPGCITHIYCTPAGPPTILRTAVLRMYWDGEDGPSVQVPLGDFFATGDCNVRLFASPFVVVNHGPGTTAYNAYFPMPFRKEGRITLENGDLRPIRAFWYHIEYELYDRDFPADTAYFHAQWRRENPTRVLGEGPEGVPADKVNRTIWGDLWSEHEQCYTCYFHTRVAGLSYLMLMSGGSNWIRPYPRSVPVVRARFTLAISYCTKARIFRNCASAKRPAARSTKVLVLSPSWN